MPFYPIRDDITRLKVDAIVNAANRSLLGGGGVDGAIHKAAGPELLAECRKLNGCETGQVKLTKGYRLPAKYVIHTVGPVYTDGRHGEEKLLRSCYSNALHLAEKEGFESVAFPLISSGVYGYPKKEAIRVATEEITAFVRNRDMTVYLVFYDRESFTEGRSRYPDLEERILESQISTESEWWRRERRKQAEQGMRYSSRAIFPEEAAALDEEAPEEKEPADEKEIGPSCGFCITSPAARPAEECILMQEKRVIRQSPRARLDDALKNRDESFSQMLLRCIDASGMTDPECYHRANIDKKLFSKIRSSVDYRPSKFTAVAFAVALKLDLDQTELLLRRAGYALNDRDPFDIIVKFFITERMYDLTEINNVLFQYDQPLLGNCVK